MRKLRHKVVTQPAWGHTTSDWHHGNSSAWESLLVSATTLPSQKETTMPESGKIVRVTYSGYRKSASFCNIPCLHPDATSVFWNCSFLFFFFFKNFYCYSITVIWIFSPSLHPTPAKPISLPRLHPPPWFCPCVLYSSSCNPLSSLSRPHSPVTIVRLFLTSKSLVIFCFLFFPIYYVPVKGEIIW